ncbi:uncharacterized protein EAE97_007259 [Botrytis byssoidea]|uniref:AB hydrolase-1 domain-containing protein n=1 Tax=Botrytis byssoidea TaxID=139641 RepID=A0A9P5IF09_9HELO|nr:uncharacterized protein EAE97_007259 [Botrytis byssoidea]KAF7939178.1 hypothetical protein EAE97_007259 [Botrytis byssoidea]
MSTSETKPTLILLSGSWHNPQNYLKLVSALSTYSYDLLIPSLPSMNGAQPPTADLYTDTDFVRSYISDLVSQGKHIIVLMHSYGGQVGTNALTEFAVSTRKSQGLSGGVVHLLYISAFMMLEGESMMDKVRLFGHEELIPVVFTIAEDGTHVHSDPRTLLIGSNPDDKVTEAEIEEYISNLSRWNGNAMYQPLKDRAAWRVIETSYVITKMDMTVFLDFQVSMLEAVKKEGKEVRVWELETGHSPTLTMTDELVKIILEVAGKY